MKTEADANSPTPPKKLKKKLTPIDLLKMKMSNMTNSEIARVYDITPAAISYRLSSVINKLELLSDKDKLAEYKAKKVDILTGVEYEILKYMTSKSTLKAASLNNLAYSLQNINNISRLEQGKSTANLSHLHQLHDSLQAKINEIDIQLSDSDVSQADTDVNDTTPEINHTPLHIDMPILQSVVEIESKDKSLND